MSPLSLYAAIALAAAILSGTCVWRIDEWRHAAIDVHRIEQEREDRARTERSVDLAAEGHEADKAEIATRYRTITEEVTHVVEKPVYRNVCLEPGGLLLANRAIAGARAASGPAPAVPGPEAAR